MAGRAMTGRIGAGVRCIQAHHEIGTRCGPGRGRRDGWIAHGFGTSRMVDRLGIRARDGYLCGLWGYTRIAMAILRGVHWFVIVCDGVCVCCRGVLVQHA